MPRRRMGQSMRGTPDRDAAPADPALHAGRCRSYPRGLQRFRGRTPLDPGGPTNGLEDTIDVVDHVIAFHKEHGTGPWAVEELASSRVIGDCGLFPVDRSEAGLDGDLELAFRLRRASWGQGYATEAAGAVIAYGFEDLGATRIVADVDADNAASSRVLEKLGFVVVGTGAERGTSLLYYALDAPRTRGSGA